MEWGKEKRVPAVVRQLLLSAIIAAAGTGCVSTDIKPLDSEEAVAIEQDEQQLWSASDRLTERIEEFGATYDSAELTNYLQDISDRLLESRPRAPERPAVVRVMSSPATNAFMLANGHMYITTGLIGRLDNEDQIATIIGHELVHYINRHSLKESREAHNKNVLGGMVTLLAAGVGGAVGGQGAGDALARSVGVASRQWARASISGYSRELETEADDGGFAMMAASGYDVRRAPSVFEALIEDMASEQNEEPYFYATHPKLTQRLERYVALAEASAATFQTSVDAPDATYLAFRAGVQLHNAGLLLDEEEYERAEAAILDFESLAGASARSAFLLGELERKRAPRNVFPQDSLAHYEKALAFEDPPVETYREYGLLLRRRDDADAAVYLNRYLELDPTAIDAGIIRRYLETDNDD